MASYRPWPTLFVDPAVNQDNNAPSRHHYIVMAKRKLSKQQQRRIRAKQKQHLDATQTTDIDESQLGEQKAGLLQAHFGNQVNVLVADSDPEIYRCYLRANLNDLAVGDHVICRINDQGEGVVEARRERFNVLKRPDSRGQEKTLAANIDRLVIVNAIMPLTYPHIIDRYLVAAENYQIAPLIIINKIDLEVSQRDQQDFHWLQQALDAYRQLDYPIIETSTKSSQGLQQLQDALAGKTAIFVGQSGVGKSSLIQQLMPDQQLKVGAVSQVNRKGTHTTTTATLYPLTTNGYLIDSPGIREFGMQHFDLAELIYGFKDLRRHMGQCKFRDCQHDQEPQCAIQAALASDEIAEIRKQSYRRLRFESLEPNN